MKFLCDHMVSRIGKWLRAAGYDTAIVKGAIPDREILVQALAEKRLLITRDRHFLKMKEAAPILYYLKPNDLHTCLNELNRQIDINWLLDPFTRCLTCNTLLQTPNEDDLIEKVPLRIRQQKPQFWYCPSCHQYYWEGTHTQRMLRQLQSWQETKDQPI